MKNKDKGTKHQNELDSFIPYEPELDSEQENGTCKLQHKNNHIITMSGIDYIKLNVEISIEDMELYKKKLMDLSKKQWRSKGESKQREVVKKYEYVNIVKPYFNTAKSRGYSTGFSIYFDGSPCPLAIYLKANNGKNKTYAKVIFQLNPNKHCIKSIINIRKFIIKVFGKSFLTINNTNVSRYDVNYDISNLSISDLFYVVNKKEIFKTHIGRGGSFETLYLGEENNGLVIYDKMKHIKKKMHEKVAKLLGNSIYTQKPLSPITRFEFRKKCRKLTLFALLHGYEFEDLSCVNFYSIDQPIQLDKTFMGLAKCVGLQPALKSLDPKARAAITKTLEACRIPMEHDNTEIQHSLHLIKLLICGKAQKNGIISKFSERHKYYIHTGIIDKTLLRLSGLTKNKPTKEQREILKIKGNIKAALGQPITREQAMKLIALGENKH